METTWKYEPLEDLKDKEFYKKCNVGKIDMPFEWGYVALDRLQRIIVIESNPERARAKSISLGCESPRICDATDLNVEFYRKHNKKLEQALSNKTK